MKIVDRFAVVEESLYSVLFDTEVGAVDENDEIIPNEKLHEFNRLFDFWNDANRLREFFEKNENDLNDDYWEGITIDEAIRKTRNEAKKLKLIILEYAQKGKTERLYNLSTIFKPLTDGKYEKKLEKDKVRLDERKAWLRMYAIRIDANFFMICGGSIKLRETLNDRIYLLKELEKLEITQKLLSDGNNGIFDICEFY